MEDVRVKISVADPNPDLDPPDPHVLRPPGSGSGSLSQRYGSGFGSCYHSAKRETLISTVLFCDFWFDFLSLKNEVNIPSKSNMQKNCFPDPHQNVMDQQHWQK
jgi:hypothetical protein